jgi:hypothetical protein
MSEPITLTERERAVFAHMACTLGNGTASHDIIVSNALLHFLDADFRTRSAELASPPRVPGASVQRLQVGVESGPGQPMDICDLLKVAEGWGDPAAPAAVLAREAANEICRLREQVRALEREAFNLANRSLTEAEAAREEGRRVGIEAAAQAAATYVYNLSPREWSVPNLLTTIRALADKPAPAALRTKET